MKGKQSAIRFISFHVPIVLLIISTLFFNANYIIKVIKAENSVEDINFDSPFNNTINLGAPFLVEYDNTTGLKPTGVRTTNISSEDFEVTFSGFGVINHPNGTTIRYYSNGSGFYITNPDGSVYQKGVIELRTGEGNDTAKAEYESIGDQAGEERVLDNGIMFFSSSSPNGELSFLNNTLAVYKDMIGVGGSNITTIAWKWK